MVFAHASTCTTSYTHKYMEIHTIHLYTYTHTHLHTLLYCSANMGDQFSVYVKLVNYALDYVYYNLSELEH